MPIFGHSYIIERNKYKQKMIFDYEPGDYVINPENKEWGTGQIQSIIKNIVTVNFENAGKKTIIADKVLLEKINAKN